MEQEIQKVVESISEPVTASASSLSIETTKSSHNSREFIAEYPKSQEEIDGMFRYPPIPIFSALPVRKLIISWRILSIKTVTNSRISDAVMEVSWEATGSDVNGNEGSYVATTVFDTNKISMDNFVDLKDITEDMIIYWLKESFNERYMDHIHAQITNDINQRKSLVMEFTENKLPWKK